MAIQFFVPERLSKCPLLRHMLEQEIGMAKCSAILNSERSLNVYVSFNEERKSADDLFKYSFFASEYSGSALSSIYTSRSFREAARFKDKWS